jgi:hypothetical protein
MTERKDYSDFKPLINNTYLNTENDIRITIKDIYYGTVRGKWISKIKKENEQGQTQKPLREITEREKYILIDKN